jgi:DNA-binding response OmpR family regulator
MLESVSNFRISDVGTQKMTGAKPIPPDTRHHILVVDDEAAIRTMVAKVLGAHYRVSAASSPHEALALAGKEQTVNLILLDVMMPGMDGFDLAKRLKLLPSCAKAPIMFLTARDAAGDKIKGIQAGARSYITKPFKIEDLTARVKKALGD